MWRLLNVNFLEDQYAVREMWEYSPQTSDATSLGATYTAFLINTIWDVL